ncbi:hypothetical protein LTR86_005741 [Recurvomyces mirabilis]|nr:hypothetical protein LTR86_005741 [Recurvomyces mirabilis]
MASQLPAQHGSGAPGGIQLAPLSRANSSRSASPLPPPSPPLPTAPSTHPTGSHRPHAAAQNVPLLSQSAAPLPASKGARFNQGADRWLAHLKQAKHDRLFVYLTVFAAVMVIINIIQAACLDYLHSLAWIVVFPAVVLGAMILTVFLTMALSVKELLAEWRAADVPDRVARIGIVLSILLPIIVCEFIYMPLVAIPAWHSIRWTTSLRVESPTLFAAVVVAVSQQPAFLAAYALDPASCEVILTTGNSSFCQLSDVQHTSPVDYANDTIEYDFTIFNPLHQTAEGATYAWDAIHTTLSLGFTASYTPIDEIQTIYNQSQIYIGFYDATLPFNIDDFLAGCRNPDLYFKATQRSSDGGGGDFYPEIFELSDSTGELRDSDTESSATICSSDALALRDYTYYGGRFDPLPLPAGCSPVIGSTTTCGWFLSVHLQSSLATTQKSSRGTNTLQILIDEGSILGGILFFTWFFGIFVV